MKQTDTNVITTGCFKITLDDGKSLNIDKVLTYAINSYKLKTIDLAANESREFNLILCY